MRFSDTNNTTSLDHRVNIPPSLVPVVHIQNSFDGFDVTSCNNYLPCLRAFEWGKQQSLAHCEQIFLDVGSNIGVHSRFFFEPDKYDGEDHPYKDLFNNNFGPRSYADRISKQCAVAFEPNPAHVERHRNLTAAYIRMGWRYKAYFVAAGAPRSEGDSLVFYKQDRGSFNDWGFSLTNQYGGADAPKFVVPIIDLAHFLKTHISARPTLSAGDPTMTKSFVVMKMDIEGSEYGTLQHMLLTGTLSYINVLTIEWHERMCPINVHTSKGQDVVWSQQECVDFAQIFPKLVQDEYGTQVSNIDDESNLFDGKPFPDQPAYAAFSTLVFNTGAATTLQIYSTNSWESSFGNWPYILLGAIVVVCTVVYRMRRMLKLSGRKAAANLGVAVDGLLITTA